MGLKAVAMSGGVDSSVAACLLAQGDAPLVGFSMQLVDRLAGAEDRYGRCCSPEDFRDARRVAEAMGFPHYVLDLEDEFRKKVLEPFATDYAAGRTPSPCIRCNTFMKFDTLVSRARAVGAESVATGHYAILEDDPRSGRRLLRQAADLTKDQSYFLFDLSDEQRRRAEFPLGRLQKDQVRELAREWGLGNADKAESMDLCFVAKGESYRDFLKQQNLAPASRAGAIVDDAGQVLGSHSGVENFTVGQRRGIGIAAEEKLYVLKVDAAQDRIVVGGAGKLEAETCIIERVRWIPFERPQGPIRGMIRINSNHEGAPGTIRDHGDGTAEVRFDDPQRALTPGQAAVAYDGDLVLGGGWISG